MIRASSREISRDNLYDEMHASPERRLEYLELSILRPNSYKLRIFKDLVADPQGLIDSYLIMTGGTDEKVQQLIFDRANLAREKHLDLSIPLPTVGFDNRLLEILRLITPETIKKMSLAYRSVLQLTKAQPFAQWKMKVGLHLNETGTTLKEEWSQEAFILSNCKNCEDVVKWLVLGRVISRIEASPISDDALDAYAQQEARMRYIKTVLLTAALQMHILL